MGYALRRCADPDDAADVVAETFMIAWRRIAEVPAGPVDLSQLGRVFRALSDDDRELLSLVAWERLDPGQIARTLGISRNAARVRLYRARRRFARALAAAGIDTARAAAVEGSVL
ncbi:hypothetical protein OHA25_22085 [Nonomuraea sp. NBC_00507]|uniref:RNA polymerase sigma factor n=1 Tax=Nonomuraea sp. NBC_00507 TaxID=2976002 RepID=UPI002E17C7DB